MWPKNALNISRPNISNMCVCAMEGAIWMFESYSGWWHTYPSEKYESVGMIIPFPTIYGKSWKFHGSSHHQPEISPNSQDLWLKICETHVGAMVIYPIMRIHYQPGQAWGPSSFDELILSWMASILGNLQARLFFYHQILYSFPLSNFPPKKKMGSNPCLFTAYHRIGWWEKLTGKPYIWW